MTDNNGQGNVIRRNRLHGTYDGLHPCGDSAPDGAFTSETDVYDNVIWSHSDDAIESEGYCSNVRIWNNTISDSLMAVAVAPASPGPTWIVRNTAYDIGNVALGPRVRPDAERHQDQQRLSRSRRSAPRLPQHIRDDGRRRRRADLFRSGLQHVALQPEQRLCRAA